MSNNQLYKYTIYYLRLYIHIIYMLLLYIMDVWYINKLHLQARLG